MMGWLAFGGVVGFLIGRSAYREWQRINVFLDSLSDVVREELAAADAAWDEHVASALGVCGDDWANEPTPIYDELAVTRFADALAEPGALEEWLNGGTR